MRNITYVGMPLRDLLNDEFMERQRRCMDYMRGAQTGTLTATEQRIRGMQNMGLGGSFAGVWHGQAAPMYVPFQIQPVTTLEERNEIKRQKAIAYLGDKWILSPAQQVKRKEAAE